MKIILNQPFSFHQNGLRGNQEDSRWPDLDTVDASQRFFIVCDGVGGEDCGEVASQTVCQAFAEALDATDWNQPFADADFQQALNHAYDALDNKKDANPEMATTLTLAAFHEAGCTVAHIGDSRIYQVRPGAGILYRSNDHSLVNALVHSGNLSPDKAEDHPQGNVITRYMGPATPESPRLSATVVRLTDIQPGDYFVLCSDGVLHQVDDEQLEDILGSDTADEEKCRQLATLSHDSSDNNTLWLIPVKEVENDEEQDAGEEPGEDEAPGDGRATTNLRKQNTDDTAHDVEASEPAVRQSMGSKVANFFKRLFS